MFSVVGFCRGRLQHARWPQYFPISVRILLVVMAAGLVGMPDVLAHQTKLSSTRMSVNGGVISAEIEMNGIDLNLATGVTLAAADGTVDASLVTTHLDTVRRYVFEHVRLETDGSNPCEASWGSAIAKQDHVVLERRWACPQGAGLTYAVTLFHEIDPVSRHMVSVEGAQAFIGLLSVQSPRMSVSKAAPTKWQTAGQYVVSGIEHIAIGYDHIAFLLAVIVLGRRFWPLFKVITAFTIAHSITLTLAVLGVVVLPSVLVESLIAASIVYVAAENFFVRDIRHRWWVTFAFGLIHGFGFASVLRDYGLPDEALGIALATFNIGVEIGQLLIVLVAVMVWQFGFRAGAIAGVRRTEHLERRLSLGVSGAVMVAGLYWLGERLLSM